MKLTFFTSITLNYLPKAQALARSLKQFHPEARFYLVVAEPAPADLCTYEPAFDEVITPEAFPLPGGEAWLFRHTVVEICTALKGYALAALLARGDAEGVIYLDPDTVVFNRLEPVEAMLAEHDVVLTPHLCEPEATLEAIADNEICALKHGVYNLGFLAVANRPEGLRFAAWWRDRLETFCRADVPQGLFTDQRWADLVPSFFPTCGILRHPGCNVATWNLSRRRIEGDFPGGFQVNGLPLIFYHFSGFDAGAQFVMLRRYAADQPAAFQLRNWYVEESARLDARGFHRRRWAYGYFDNGEPIHTAYRVRYRDDPALPVRFPRPFATAGDSLWRWLGEQGLRLPPPPGPPPPTPLQRYMEDPDLFRIAPYPSFDGASYLRENGDVAAAGLNPLLHYTIWGEAENRRPHAEVYVDCLRQQATASEHLLAAYECAGRTGRTHPRYHARHDQANLADLRRRMIPGRPVILSINHCGSGGTGISVARKLRLTRDGANNLMFTSQPSYRTTLSMPLDPDAPELLFDQASAPGDRVSVARALGVQYIHIHHALYNEAWLLPFLRELNLPYKITLHDYYFLAPQPHLTDASTRFVGDDRLDDETLARPFRPGAPTTTLGAWRGLYRPLLEQARQLIAPSHDLARRFLRVYPGLAITVVPHHENPRPESQPVSTRPCRSEEPARVLLLGSLLASKGRDVLRAVSRLAQARGAPLEFYLLGEAEVERPEGVVIHGAYTHEELHPLIEALSPHLAWFPAQCPESYSYTLSEAMQAGLPILASALGSLPERLAGRPWSWLHPWDASPESWLERLLEIRAHHLVGHEPAVAPGSPPQWDTNFYPDAYLSDI